MATFPAIAVLSSTVNVQQTRILVVGDDEDVCAVVHALLADAGFSVDRVLNGADARATLAGNRYDLIVLDAFLPGERGLTLADYAAQLDLGVVVTSGHPLGMKLSEESAYASLRKPFGQAELLQTALTALASPVKAKQTPEQSRPCN